MDVTSFDLIVVGGGPAGSSAALYGARAGLSVACIEPYIPCGQISQSDLVDNYPGLPDIAGSDLSTRLFDHAITAGVAHISQTVESIEKLLDGSFSIQLDEGSLHARSVICALGASPRKAGFSGEEAFTGRGVSYCATCDAMFFKGKTVYVVGGGKTACEEALFLSRFAREVIMLVRKDVFRAPNGITNHIAEVPNITVRFSTIIKELSGVRMPEKLVLQHVKTEELETIEYQPGAFGVFVFVGFDPQVDLVKDLVELDLTLGGVVTGEDMSTKTPGLFCAGDMRSKYLRQVVTAVSDGAIAATAATRYLDDFI